MNKKVKRFLNQHPGVDYIQRLVRHYRDKEFRDMVLGYHRNPDLLFLQNFGDEYPDISFYDIYMNYPSKGFFALLCQTLDALRYAGRFGLTPVVTWSDSCLYKEQQPVNGSSNPFEYYFEPVSAYFRDDLAKAKHVLPYYVSQRALDQEHPFTIVSKTIVEAGCYSEYIQSNAEAWKRYIRIKKPVMDYIQNSLKEISFGDSTLGVHVRATDFNNGYVNHAVAVQKEEYIDAVHEAIEKNPQIKQIFLATDDQATIAGFEAAFPGMIICYSDTFRSTDGEAIHFSISSREQHKYLLGLEVMRDMYTLSKCNGLIGGLSNVCIAAQIVNAASDQPYRYLNVIDKGFNKSGKTTYEDRFGSKGNK